MNQQIFQWQLAYYRKHGLWPVAGGTAGTFDQDAFHGRDDDGSETTATFRGAVNSNFSQAVDTNFRIRFVVQETAGGSTNNFREDLQYNRNGLGWNDVDDSASLVVRMATSGNFAHGDDTTQQVGSGTFLTLNDGMNETNPPGSTALPDFSGNDETEFEFCIQIRDADVQNDDTIQLRVTNNGSAFAAYTNTPTITVTGASPTTQTGFFPAKRYHIQPSYRHGYARNAAESARPDDWKGLIGLWIPQLGPTGLELRDISGFKNDGTLTGMDVPTDWQLNEGRYVLDFDGTDLVDFGDVGDVLTGQLSILAWFKWDGAAADQHIFQKGDTGDTSYTIRTRDTGSVLTGIARQTDGSTNLRVDGPTAINDGLWHLATFTVIDTVRADLYLDSVLEGSDTVPAGTWNTNSASSLGMAGFGSLASFVGQISQARLYSRALSESEIKEIYRDPLGIVRRKQRHLPVAEQAAAASDSQLGVTMGANF